MAADFTRSSDDRLAGCSEQSSLADYLKRGVFVDLAWCAGVALVLTLIFADTQGRTLTAREVGYIFLFNMIISLGIGLSLSNLFRWVQPRLVQRFPGPRAYWTTMILLLVGGVAFGVEIAIRVIARLGGPSESQIRPDVLRVGLVIAGIIVAAQIAFDRLRRRAREVELRAEQAQREALRAQLEALQARTNPHFLFNSLNTVAGLIEEDPAAAERVLEKLSSLFRYSLAGSKTSWVRLDEELSSVRDYLEVERVRLGDRLKTRIVTGPEVGGLLVPPLMLQPLVENAVLHAVAPRKEGGLVEIHAERNGSRLSLAVVDDGPGLGNSPHRGSGTSLVDLRQRLEMLYGDAAGLESGAGPDGGCRIELSLPIEPGMESDPA